ncbi:acylphosphatase [Vulgatibacter sp.]|uniref:acylphosphatase n=1 Tax=Vulgatibacter sp. TaxID=1971226 RepID=UPI0035695444
MVRVELKIIGRVQGVFYRASAQRAAEERGLLGWVRNTGDGAVEAVVEGPRPQVEDFVAWCRQGPVGARVDEVEANWSPARAEFSDFRVRR